MVSSESTSIYSDGCFRFSIWEVIKWQTQINMGMIPYYMFIERDTGARAHFELPLVETWEIFQKAYQQVSGLGRTVRGPSMSATPGKVQILGMTEIPINGSMEKYSPF